jgi:Protein of unknown function (DUF2786)
MLNTTIDPKVIDRVQKLLNLARDGGATEGEAAAAMERAEAIMHSNNLSMAMIEASGGHAVEKRLKDAFQGRAAFRWQHWLMRDIAEATFCHVIPVNTTAKIRYGATRRMQTGYELIGRISNVTAARQMFDYLNETIARLRKEYGGSNRDGALFAEGVAARLQERIKSRHRELLRQQKEEARKQTEAAAARRASGDNSGFALVVVMEDYVKSEGESNNDVMHGWPLGTTKKKREDSERDWREKDAKQKELIAQGIDSEVAWSMAHLNWSREKAEAYQETLKTRKSNTHFKFGRYRKSREERMEERMAERSYSRQWQDGANAADKIGLDEQVGKTANNKLIGD